MGFCLKLTGMLLAALVAIGAGFYFNFEHALSSGLPIPGAPAAFPFGNVLEIVKDPNFLVGLETLTKTHADKASGLASIWQFSTQVISATDPDDIQAILATPTRTDPPHVTKLFGHTIGRRSLPVASDADWPTLRTVVHRAVRKIHLPRFVPEVFQAVDALAHKLTTSGRQLDAAVYLRGMVYDLVGRYAYNTPITGVNDGLQAAVDFLYRENIRRTTSPNPIDGHFWIPTDLNVRLNEARDKFRSSIQQEIRARRQGSSSDPNHEDFLKYLLEEDSLDEETLIDTVSSMVFGSTETFVSLLTYAVYVTGSEPEIQARIYEEAKSAFADPAAFKVGSLPYTNRVLKETLRLYPPAPLTQRTVPASGGRPPILLNGTVAVPAGTSVWVPIWAAHRREETFSDPLRFDPSRFEADEAPRGYLPFGAGPRNCVAAAFAEGLGTVILARLVYGAEFTTVGPSTPQAFGNGFVQFALHGVPLIAKERV